MEEDIYYKGCKIKIRQDEDSESPNEWGDEDLFLVYDHRQFTVKREGFNVVSIYHWIYAKEIVKSGDDVDGNYQEEMDGSTELNNYFIFPVEAYIHSGVSLSLFSGTKQCGWDSSVSGYILVSRTTQIATDDYTSVPEDKAKEYAEGLIETWNTYLSGDVWGFIVEKPNTTYSISKEDFDTLITTGTFTSDNFLKVIDVEDEWEEVDSCWGFYGQDAAINEAKLVIDNLTKE